jgi:hypothetical protein
LAAVDVAVGLVALFFLLSTAISAINEGIANVLGWRAKTLEDAIRNLVGDPQMRQGWRHLVRGGWRRIGRIDTPAGPAPEVVAGKQPEGESGPKSGAVGRVEPPNDTTLRLFDHWRVRSLVRDPESDLRRRARPSYMPPRAFSLALAETLAKGPPRADAPDKKSPWELADAEILERVKGALDDLPEGQLRSLVLKAVNNAHESLEGFRAQLEHAFDDSMERASGWYKRKVQTVLLIIAAVIVIGLNVNTVQVATVLWNDDALRSAVAARAAAQGTPEDAAAAVDDISELELPLGWGANAPDNVLYAIPGWLIAIAALNLGAPFWFDLLSRLARLRGSGVPERPRSLSDTAGTVDTERAARRDRAMERIESSLAGAERERSGARDRTGRSPRRTGSEQDH